MGGIEAHHSFGCPCGNIFYTTGINYWSGKKRCDDCDNVTIKRIKTKYSELIQMMVDIERTRDNDIKMIKDQLDHITSIVEKK